jgi:hypothetical protein
MIINKVVINGKEFKETIPGEGKILHKIGTDEYYSRAIDLLDSNFEYEEIEEEKYEEIS